MSPRRINPGDLVTSRFDHGAILTQNMYKPNSRSTRLNMGKIALVTWTGPIPEIDPRQGRDVARVLFMNEQWIVSSFSLRVVNDG
jgi:hypothetical protein